MVPRLPVATANGARRASTPWVTGGLKVQCRALHSLDSLDFTEDPTPAPGKDWKDGGHSRIIKQIRPPRRVLGREGKRREVSRLCPLNSQRITDYKFTKIWTDKMRRGSPALVRHMPGFVESQSWFQHPESNRDGEFTTRTSSLPTEPKREKPSFAVLRDSIIASALRQGADTDNSHSAMSQLFDSLGVKFKIKRTNLLADASDDPFAEVPLEKFMHWLVRTGRSSSHNLDSTVDRLLKSVKDSSFIWEPFEAPIAFIREVLRYNDELGPEGQADAICRLMGLIELEDRLTEDFPYPPVVRDIGGLTYNATSCSIRFGIRPLRSDLRNSTDATVIGQLAGYSRALLIPPQLTSLGGESLLFHPQVREMRKEAGGLVQLGHRQPKTLQKSIWTRDFEESIPERIDASLKPGDALMIPPGWWYGIRSINYYNQLHATVGWFLETDQSPYKLWRERNPEVEAHLAKLGVHHV